jgi:hypothetical protein
MKIKEVLESKYCWIVIGISLILSYFLIIRKFTVFTNFWSILLSIIYVATFTISNTCLIKEIKETIKSEIKSGANTILSILGSVLGFGAVQLCTVSGTCSINIVTSLLFSLLPTSLSLFFTKNGIWILLFADILLIISIYRMNCFKKNS